MPRLTFQAKILDHQLTPISRQAFRVVESGKPSNVLLTKTVNAGTLSASVDISGPARNIDVVVQMKIGRVWKTISLPVSIRQNQSFDIGAITVFPEPIIFGGSEYYGLSIDSVGSLITKASKDFEGVSDELVTSKSKVKEMTKAYNLVSAQRLKDNQDWKQKNTKLAAALKDKESIATNLAAEKKSLEALVEKGKANVTKIEAKLEGKTAEADQLAGSIADMEIAMNQAVKAKENAETALETETARFEKRIDDLEAALADTSTLKTISMDGVGTSVGGQLMNAKASMDESPTGFKIGKVTMEVKGIPYNDAGELKFGFLDVGEMTSLPSGSLSSFTYEYLPGDGDSEPATEKAKVPDVVGNTEIYAVRELERIGFYVETSYQTVETPANAGKIVRQLPAKGSDRDIGSIVKIFIGKLMGGEG